MKRVFISGVSTGIGFALANLYLEKGWTVFGISRRIPEALLKNENFVFKTCDLQKLEEVHSLFDGEFSSIVREGVSAAYLNAGISGNVPLAASEFSVADVNRAFTVNTLANKILLDTLVASPNKPEVIVVSASIAGLRFRAGMLTYSMSKAALLAMCGVYAQENPDVFFAVIGMCNVNTKLSSGIVFSSKVSEFPAHLKLQERFRKPGYAVSPTRRAADVFEIVHNRRTQVLKSGEFVEIREILEQFEEA